MGTTHERPAGNVRLVRDLADGVGVLALTTRKETTYYTVVEIPCEIGGRGPFAAKNEFSQSAIRNPQFAIRNPQLNPSHRIYV